jgi:hypothetical protein
MSVVLWAMFQLPALTQYWLAFATAACTGLSGLQYLFDGMKQLSASPHSAPKPHQH